MSTTRCARQCDALSTPASWFASQPEIPERIWPVRRYSVQFIRPALSLQRSPSARRTHSALTAVRTTQLLLTAHVVRHAAIPLMRRASRNTTTLLNPIWLLQATRFSSVNLQTTVFFRHLRL